MRGRTEGKTDGLRDVGKDDGAVAALGLISGWNEADSQTPPAMPHTIYIWVGLCLFHSLTHIR